ncbi:alpha-L-arabinofuranosidase C-terminal domain-containing protein [Fulvivirga ligni]|uniref:alpha-L-arabinofuranosidase C-terminal domain-containing protein n=1 Tax=Fulvivirga ligni TaxID=2904246 RepID=UPI001F3352AA|nr:alpha-L-arabinofuranosidase C-terminal domain-containing protein [Fulvivirga ligni]UII23439.1 alpha-L-arabinofuranosidase [Fulvivirga ligni]
MISKYLLIVCCSLALSTTVFAQEYNWQLDTKPKANIQPTMYGVFFEDINFAADGGLYAELVKNRSFEFDEPLMGWIQPNSDRHSLNEKSGIANVIKRGDEPNNHFARVNVKNASGYQLINEGFRGMGIKDGAQYNLTLQARLIGEIKAIKVQLINEQNAEIAAAIIKPGAKDWKEYSATLTANGTAGKAKMKLTFEGAGEIDLDMISLFPEDTWKGRKRGLRKDLVQLLYDLKPGFLRFPGGCIVEGRTLAKRYQWKKTVGDEEDREMLINRWNTEFGHRLTPDYYQSFGIGFFEYFQLSEDLGAEPLPILSCGMACQFNTGELVPMDQLDPYVQDALDLIEFANGDTSSKWGKLRADMGHPEPFNLKYIGVGNEQWGPDYFDRLKVFIKSIKSQYPDMIVVSGTGPFPDGEQFEYAEKQLENLDTEIVDEHYYRSPEWFLDNADRYDSYDRDRYKIFAGEYAAQSVAIASPENKNNWNCALSEAAYMTGLERNADVVYMTSYAPLFAHVDAWQWTPDLIWFDNLKSYGTANYYVQKLYSNNPGTKLLSITNGEQPIKGQDRLYASAVLDDKTGEVIVKLVNANTTSKKVNISLKSGKMATKGTVQILRSSDLDAVNSLDKPMNVSPVQQDLKLKGGKLSMELEPGSFYVIRTKTK